MYVTVSPRGTITFRLDYRLNGRRETLTIGRYGSKDGISLLMARERSMEARKAIAEGQSPSQEKQREKRRMSEAKTFDEFTKRWLEEARMADSTKSMRKSIIDRDIMPVFGNRVMAEIGPEDLRNLCAKVKARGAPATAVHVRDIVKQVFGFAALHGDKAPNPADEVGPSSIATFVAKDRALSPSEIRVMHRVLDATATLPTIRLALRMILLTLVRKSELIEATWDEVDFENAVWTIPKSRMKAGKPHNVYSAVLLNDLPPGTYLLGIRRLQRDVWFWQEMVLTLASSWWRTEVYLDSVEDDFTSRRFELDSASVLIEPGKGSGSLRGSEARFTEAARIALSEGRLGVDDHLLRWLLGPGIPSPMLALYTAYALALAAEPDVNRVRTLCDHLKERWTERSADVKLLEGWCDAAGGKESVSPSIEFRPDEVPMIAYGWEVASRLGQGAALPLAAQEHVGVWRTSSTLWTQMQVPSAEEGIHTFRQRTTHQLPRRLDGAVDFQALSGALIRPGHELSPLQQALRRALIDAREIGELDFVGPTLEKIGAASGVDADVVVRALEGLLAHSSKGDEEFATLTV